MPELSIVIPVFNSEENLTELRRRLDEALAGMEHEVILVNDGSSDQSWERICALAREFPRTVGINLRKNFGQDNAIMAGLNQARGNYLVIMDDDLQHSPSDIPVLHEKCRQGYDVCYANFARKKQAWWKNLGSWANGKAAELLLDKPPHIYLSPFQVITRAVAEEVVRYSGPFPYVQGLILNVTRNLAQVETTHHRRYRGRGNFTLLRSLGVFLKLATSFSVIPLRFATMTGFVAAAIGFLLALYYLFEYFWLAHTVEGWTTLVLVNLILGGLILFTIGLIGEYIGRIYLNIIKKPQFIIKEITGDRP